MAGAFFFFQKDASKDISTDQASTIIEVDSNDINAALFEQGTYTITFLYENEDGKAYQRTMNCVVEDTPVFREEPEPTDTAEKSAVSDGENKVTDAAKTNDTNRVWLLATLCVIALLTAFSMIKYFIRRKSNGRL